MTLHLSAPRSTELNPRITVFGVGGAGGNAVNNMIDAGVMGCDFIVANTDAQALQRSKTETRVQLGIDITQGLGAGARPEVGSQAALESIAEVESHLDGTHMVFVTAGMGGGTGTGAAPIIAQAAREKGILTVGVVTKPFQFEGSRRMTLADAGIAELQQHVDTLIVIPNQNLFRVANERTTFAEAFAMADQVLCSGVRSITDLMVMPGLINLDFADVRTVMSEMGKAMMGSGDADGERRAVEAAQAAINNPLLDEVSMKGAKGVLINITGGYDLTLYEVDEAANEIRAEVDPDANIIVGSSLDENMEGFMRVSVVATGIESEAMEKVRPEAVAQRPVTRPNVGWRPPAMAKDNSTVHDMQAEVAARVTQEFRDEPAEDAPAEVAPQAPTPVQNTAPPVQTHHRPEPTVEHHVQQPEASAPQTVAPEVEDTHETEVPSMPRRGHVPEAAPQYAQRAEPEDAGAKRFSLFGWGRGKAKVTEHHYERADPPQSETVRIRETNRPVAQPQQAVETPADNADLFGQQDENDVVDIPAFLRR